MKAPSSRGTVKPAVDAAAEETTAALSRDLSRFEFTFITFFLGYSRWVEKCMEAAGIRGLGALDILVLHAVNHRARRRRLSEGAMVINIEDVHLVGYSLKKLAAAGLVRTDQDGRHRLYEASESGDAACAAYRQTRESHLVESLERLLGDGSQLVNDSHFLRLLMGAYDQAGRFAMAESLERLTVPPVHTKR